MDKNGNCPLWAQHGHCQSAPGYMLPNCPHSCKVCAGNNGEIVAFIKYACTQSYHTVKIRSRCFQKEPAQNIVLLTMMVLNTESHPTPYISLQVPLHHPPHLRPRSYQIPTNRHHHRLLELKLLLWELVGLKHSFLSLLLYFNYYGLYRSLCLFISFYVLLKSIHLLSPACNAFDIFLNIFIALR